MYVFAIIFLAECVIVSYLKKLVYCYQSIYLNLMFSTHAVVK